VQGNRISFLKLALQAVSQQLDFKTLLCRHALQPIENLDAIALSSCAFSLCFSFPYAMLASTKWQ
jgi:hypothetical protein